VLPLTLKAIEAPLREIVYNAGGEPSVVVTAILAGKGNHGFNAANDTYGDMIERPSAWSPKHRKTKPVLAVVACPTWAAWVGMGGMGM
jgi:chaperonin GroEL (HSP60 family)